MSAHLRGFDGADLEVTEPTPRTQRGRVKEPLLRPWKGAVAHPNIWTLFFGWLKHTLVAAFIFMLSSIVFMLGYHSNPRLLFGIAVFFILAFLSDALFHYMRPRGRIAKEFLIYLVCAFAVFAGGLVGTSTTLTHLVDYWPYYQKRHYTNVAPDEPAASHTDASVIVFMDGARPDGTRSVGYKRSGVLYCVAPIAVEAGYSDDQVVNSDIQYWAIGTDCCGGHKGFMCDDAINPKARSGLVMMENTDDPFAFAMEGIVSSGEMHHYDKAVKMAMTKFDLTSPKERLFVRYVQDIEKARQAYWGVAWWSWWKMQMVWFLVWAAAGAMTIVIGAGDPDDMANYSTHLVDAKQSVLFKMNHLM